MANLGHCADECAESTHLLNADESPPPHSAPNSSWELSGPGLAEELRPLGALCILWGGLWGGEVAKGRKLLPSARGPNQVIKGVSIGAL